MFQPVSDVIIRIFCQSTNLLNQVVTPWRGPMVCVALYRGKAEERGNATANKLNAVMCWWLSGRRAAAAGGEMLKLCVLVDSLDQALLDREHGCRVLWPRSYKVESVSSACPGGVVFAALDFTLRLVVFAAQAMSLHFAG